MSTIELVDLELGGKSQIQQVIAVSTCGKYGLRPEVSKRSVSDNTGSPTEDMSGI